MSQATICNSYKKDRQLLWLQFCYTSVIADVLIQQHAQRLKSYLFCTAGREYSMEVLIIFSTIQRMYGFKKCFENFVPLFTDMILLQTSTNNVVMVVVMRMMMYRNICMF